MIPVAAAPIDPPSRPPSPAGTAYPGQPGNPVGYAAAPGFTSLTPYAGGPLTPGTSGAHSVYQFVDFVGNFPTVGDGDIYIDLIGCRIQSNNTAGAAILLRCGDGGAGPGNITMNWCSFTPLVSLAPSIPGGAWPSAGAGISATAQVTGVNCIAGTNGYQFAVAWLDNSTTHISAMSGPVSITNCDMWGFGNAVALGSGTTQPITIKNNWMHDGRNAADLGDHLDCVGYLNGAAAPANVTVSGNTLATLGTTNIIAMQAASAPYSSIVVTFNLLAGDNITVDMCHLVTGNSGLVFTDNVVSAILQWRLQWLYVNLGSLAPQFTSATWQRNKLAVPAGAVPASTSLIPFTSANDNNYLLPNGTFGTADFVA